MNERHNFKKQGMMARTRGTQYQIFLRFRKTTFSEKESRKLKISENVYTDDQFEILEEQRQFYQCLYINPHAQVLKNFKIHLFLILRT